MFHDYTEDENIISIHLDDIANDTVTHEYRLTLVYITFYVAAFQTYNYSCRMTNSRIYTIIEK